MTKGLCFLIILFFINQSLSSQVPDSLRKSIHEVESEFYSKAAPVIYPATEKGAEYPGNLIPSEKGALTRKVLGWHPNWVSASAYLSYDYNSLSHVAYFSYEVDTATGGYTTIYGWNTTPLISYAHQKGTKVLLTVTNFGVSKNTKLLSDTVKQNFLINTLIGLLKSRNGDGVNFDLESVGSSQRTNLVKFMERVRKMIKSELPAAEISMAAPAVDWNGSWDINSLSGICDYLIIMGYDYYWSGSSTAGPVAPLETENYNVTRSINTYLLAGAPPEKLMLGVPWYGYDWPVVSNARKASATGTATSRIYTAAKSLALTNGYNFDDLTKVPWVKYQGTSSPWRQLWYDDTVSLALKYNLVNSKNLGGIGIWALSYDGGSPEIWRNIFKAFTPPDTSKITEFQIYPNPVRGISKIQFYLQTRQHVSLKIYDMVGKTRAILIDGYLEAGVQSYPFDSAGWGPGLYLCVLETKKSKSTFKIIIANQ